MEEKHILFSYRARYFQHGELDGKTKHVLFAIHGYGQLAKYFIRKFHGLEDIAVIVPEATSRFYLEGFDGRIGATWMTREDRLTDIQNYITYLDNLYNSLEIPKTTKVSALGFSQGAATVSRWLANGQCRFDQLILWAGIFPPDMDMDVATDIFSSKQIDYVYGESDQYITPKRLAEMKQLSNQMKLTPNVTTFQGEHQIDTDTLREVLNHHG